MGVKCKGPCIGESTSDRPVTLRLAAKIRCFLLDHPELRGTEEQRRMMLAARILETGGMETGFASLGRLTLRELKSRYISFVVSDEPTIKAAAERLEIDPSTIWENRKRLERNGSHKSIPIK